MLHGCSWMEVAGGDMELTEAGRAQGSSDFGTAKVVGVSLRRKKWYFEVGNTFLSNSSGLTPACQAAIPVLPNLHYTWVVLYIKDGALYTPSRGKTDLNVLES